MEYRIKNYKLIQETDIIHNSALFSKGWLEIKSNMY